jgi:hypothetical protein
MSNLKLYTFHRGVTSGRYDGHLTQHLLARLENTHSVQWFDLVGDGSFTYTNKDNQSVAVCNGSTMLIEDVDTGLIKCFDYSDFPSVASQLIKFSNLDFCIIGHYNPVLWNDLCDKSNREKVKPGLPYESFWQFGMNNYDDIQSFRKNCVLNYKLYWRGSIYEHTGKLEYDGCRQTLKELNRLFPDKVSFNPYHIPFDSYIQESITYKLCLGFGGGGGYTCGDFCFRDMEMYGIGIPMLRPKYHIEFINPLIPNYHYISVDIDDCVDKTFRVNNTIEVATRLIKRYDEIINDDKFLHFIKENARQWYKDTLSYPIVVDNLIKALKL